MNACLCYVHLVLLDLWRLRSLVLPQVFVVAGICLPILLLQGLKRGHVQALRRDLLTSPTGRQVRFWTTQEGELLTPTMLSRLEADLGPVELVIPDTHHVGSLAALNAGKNRVADITFETTRPGDPVLGLAGCDVLADGEKAVVLTRFLAGELGVTTGDRVRLDVSRQGGDPARLDLTVKAIDVRGGGRKIAYLDAGVQAHLEQFLRGYGVAEYRWPAATESASDSYVGYLLFCRKNDDLTARDRLFYEKDRDFRVEPVTDDARRTLFGLLRGHELRVYYLSKESNKPGVPRRLRDRPDELAERTDADEVLIPWCDPAEATSGGRPCRLVGLSLPRRTWLAAYLRVPGCAFGYDAAELSAMFPFSSVTTKKATLSVGAIELPVEVVPRKEPTSKTVPPVPPVVVPVQLLAHLDMARHQLVQYDSVSRRFVPVPEEISYARARLFARTIDDVPAVVDALGKWNLTFESQNARIREIHKQDSSLEFIVLVVSVGVFAFGVFTVANVLLDSTARKRGTLGILRVMGVSRAGVFFLVFLRAALIGVVAGGLAGAAGVGLAWGLRRVPVVITFQAFDLAAVFAGSVACCVVGSLYPAWTASRVDPYETIIEGKFR